MKTTDLTPPLLDYWVAKAEGKRVVFRHYEGDGSYPIDKARLLDANVSGGDNESTYRPSTDWAQGGPIIERDRIAILASTGVDGEGQLEWSASVGAYSHYIDEMLPLHNGSNSVSSPTPLIAAMRAKVASVYGETVPDETP